MNDTIKQNVENCTIHMTNEQAKLAYKIICQYQSELFSTFGKFDLSMENNAAVFDPIGTLLNSFEQRVYLSREQKAKPLSVQIVFSENGYLHDFSIEEQGCFAKVFSSLEEFDHALIVGASMRTREGGYDKTKFIVTCGTEQYTGRFDLHSINEKQPTSTGKISLNQYIKDDCIRTINSDSVLVAEAQRWLDYLAAIEQAGH